MRLISVALSLAAPGTSNGERPASSEYTVPASEKTSLRTSAVGESESTSGADHRIDIPCSASPLCPTADEIPKSVNSGAP